jgi:site-specific DNA-cytosine methylase
VYIFNVRLYAQGVLIVETDSAALILAVRVLRQCIRDFPDRINWASVQHAFMARDITLITRQDLETFCVRQGRLVTLVVAGTPCQDFSGASSQRLACRASALSSFSRRWVSWRPSARSTL